jgi:hypothetical protein
LHLSPHFLFPPTAVQGIQVLPLREAQAAMRMDLDITELPDPFPALNAEHHTLVVHLAQAHRLLFKSGEGLVCTENSMLELAASGKLAPGEAEFVRRYFGAQRHGFLRASPDSQLRCICLVVRQADGCSPLVGRAAAAIAAVAAVAAVAGACLCGELSSGKVEQHPTAPPFLRVGAAPRHLEAPNPRHRHRPGARHAALHRALLLLLLLLHPCTSQ